MKKILLYIGELHKRGIGRVVVRYANALHERDGVSVEILIKDEYLDSPLIQELNSEIAVHYIKPKELVERRDSFQKQKKTLYTRLMRNYIRESERLYMKRWLKKFFSTNKDFDFMVDFDMSIWKYIDSISIPVVGRFSFSLKFGYEKRGKRMYPRMKKYDKLLLITDEMQIEVEKYYPFAKEKTVLIYNPVGIEEVIAKSNDISELSKDELEMLSQDFIIGVSALESTKGRTDMIKALKILKDRGRKEKLYLIGDGPQYEELNKMIIDLELTGQVYLLGRKNNPFVWLKRAKIFCHGSYGEGLPNVLLEALSTNTPMVAYDCPTGPKDILQNGYCGSLVELGNVKEMADRLENLLKDLELQKTYKERMLLRREDFTLDKAVDKFINIM